MDNCYSRWIKHVIIYVDREYMWYIYIFIYGKHELIWKTMIDNYARGYVIVSIEYMIKDKRLIW